MISIKALVAGSLLVVFGEVLTQSLRYQVLTPTLHRTCLLIQRQTPTLLPHLLILQQFPLLRHQQVPKILTALSFLIQEHEFGMLMLQMEL